MGADGETRGDGRDQGIDPISVEHGEDVGDVVVIDRPDGIMILLLLEAGRISRRRGRGRVDGRTACQDDDLVSILQEGACDGPTDPRSCSACDSDPRCFSWHNSLSLHVATERSIKIGGSSIDGQEDEGQYNYYCKQVIN